MRFKPKLGKVRQRNGYTLYTDKVESSHPSVGVSSMTMVVVNEHGSLVEANASRSSLSDATAVPGGSPCRHCGCDVAASGLARRGPPARMQRGRIR